MRNFNIKRQINKLYTLTTVSYFRIAGASWVALLALRGFSLLQIGILVLVYTGFPLLSSFCGGCGVMSPTLQKNNAVELCKSLEKI